MTAANWEAVKKQYDNGLNDYELSFIFNIKPATLRSYRNRHKWGRANKIDATKYVAKNAIDNDVEQRAKYEQAMAIELGLNAHQARFCREYLTSYNARQAYINVYHCTLATASTNSSRLLKNANVNQFLQFLQRTATTNLLIDRQTVIGRLWTLANADIRSVVDFNTTKTIAKDSHGNPLIDADNQPVMHFQSEVALKNDADLSNVKSIKVNKHGTNITMENKQQALATLLKYLPNRDAEAIAQERFNFNIVNRIYDIRSLLVNAKLDPSDKKSVDDAIKQLDELKSEFKI